MYREVLPLRSPHGTKHAHALTRKRVRNSRLMLTLLQMGSVASCNLIEE